MARRDGDGRGQRPVAGGSADWDGGVGKTTLAVHWSHRVAKCFPDGQLYADLRGFDAGVGPVRADEVVRGFLAALGVAPEQIPAGLTAQIGLYRSLLVGRRVLVLLDNARRADQVRPLLPSSAGCLVVVTSRNDLRGLVVTGARPLHVGLMTDVEARQLLTSRIDSQRVAAAPEAVDRLVAACARLPLALAIVAARASTQPQPLPLEAVTSQLSEGSGGLTAFADEDESFDIRTVFSWSDRTLSADASALFRLLGLHPGPDISVAATAALAGATVDDVRGPLNQWTRAHLMVEHRPGRYACHDLLRVYAADLSRRFDPEPLRKAAVRRFTDHYLAGARMADQLDFAVPVSRSAGTGSTRCRPDRRTTGLPRHRAARRYRDGTGVVRGRVPGAARGDQPGGL